MSGFEIPVLLLPRGTVALMAGKEDDLPVLRDLPEERHGAPGARIVEIHERVIEHERARIVRRARQLAQRQTHGQVQQIRRPRREIGKVLPLPQKEGKISATDLKNYLKTYYADGSYDHMVFPGMVYISHPTEYGTLYTKKELADISDVCREYEIPLFLDGARLGYGLVAKTDVTLKDIAKYTDVFYIG